MRFINFSASLQALTQAIEQTEMIYRENLSFGDVVFVWTLNSLYVIYVWGDSLFGVTGGWFSEEKFSVKKIKINGCTFGGSAIKKDIIAGKGLCLEFANRVQTTSIEDISILKAISLN